jgi:hypothetical protein
MDHHFPYVKKNKNKRDQKLVRNSQNRRRGCLAHVLELFDSRPLLSSMAAR